MKRKLVVLFVLVFALLALTACGGGGGDDEVTLRLSEVHSGEDHPANVGHHRFAELAYERSDGSLNVEVFSGGVLGSEMEVMAQVQMGTIEMIRLPVPILANVEENFNALFLPGVWDGRDAMFAALDGEIGTYFAEMLQEHGMYILAWHDAGARSLYNSVRPIYTPEDLEGLRIRMQEAPLMIRLMELMGGTPVPMGPAEVYTAIQTGLVDGAENNWPSYVTSFSHYEVARYFTENEHSRVPEAVVISLEVWESLSSSQQDVLRQAAIEGAQAQRTSWAQVEVEAEAQAVAAGAEVVRLTPEQRQAFTDRIMPIWDDYPELADLIAMIRAAQS
ncbi:MAG: TRAP transporter substrate-binding protein [Oscillospiraceae bacterium]|nr:TRAP transporter substrate-binding protein [Oscillospiraceae bacterium]